MGVMTMTYVAIMCFCAFASISDSYRLDVQNTPYVFSIPGQKVFQPAPAHLLREAPTVIEEQPASRYSYSVSGNGNNGGGVAPAVSGVSGARPIGEAAAGVGIGAPLSAAEERGEGAPGVSEGGEPLTHSATSYSVGPLSFDYNRYTDTPLYGSASQLYKFTEDDVSEPRTFDKFSGLYGKFENTFPDGSVDENKNIDLSFNNNGMHEAQEDDELDGEDARADGEFDNYESTATQVANGPHQIETIETKSYHRKVPAFDVEEFKTDHKHDHSEGHKHGEVHYHQHKHSHKHDHKQEHVHKHKQEHKHVHDQHHNHAHNHGHKHGHEHKHGHKHGHEHKSGHKHDHQHGHKHGHNHGHKHNQVHKHEHHQDHKHGHEHKHDHHQEHKHDHQHGHKHGHKHDHHQEHKHDHQHGHKSGHKHDHHHGHKHGHKHSQTHGHKHGHKHHNSKH